MNELEKAKELLESQWWLKLLTTGVPKIEFVRNILTLSP